jgi:hypothetical protein
MTAETSVEDRTPVAEGPPSGIARPPRRASASAGIAVTTVSRLPAGLIPVVGELERTAATTTGRS